MRRLKQEVMTIANMTDSHSNICPICNNEVPALEIDILGTKKYVQPICECVAEQMAEEQRQREKLVQKKETRKLFSISSMGEKFKYSTFDTFNVREGSENAIKAAKKYAYEFEKWEGDSIGFWGEPGNGKTHLAYSVMNHLTTKGYVVVFISMPDLLDKIKSTFGKGSNESQEQIMKALVTCDLLIIDDIGAEKVTDWVEETVFKVIDGRYKRKKPILYTSNLKPLNLAEKLGKRSYDRLLEMCVPIENKAASFRRERAKERLMDFKRELESE